MEKRGNLQGRFRGNQVPQKFRKTRPDETDHGRAIGGNKRKPVGRCLLDSTAIRISHQVEGNAHLLREILDTPDSQQRLANKRRPPVTTELHIKRRICQKERGAVSTKDTPVILIEAESLFSTGTQALSTTDAQFRDNVYESVHHADRFGRTGLDAVHTSLTHGIQNLDA
jgi:hypothetical protein